MTYPDPSPHTHHNKMVRGLFFVAGVVAFGLGLVGVVVPALPTTPLILLAGFCWARSSARFYDWLMRHRMFGKIMRDWQERQAIPRFAKYMAWGMMGLSNGVLMYRLPTDKLWIAVLTSLICLATAVWMARLPNA